MDKSEIIISGPEYTEPELRGSIAEHLVPKMKSWAKDSVSQVDLATNESITNHEFLCKCLEIAEGLIEFGLKKRDIVALMSSNSIPTIVTAVGIILSGGILAPIDTYFKTLDLQHKFKELRPKYIICEKAKARQIQNCILSINLDAKIVLIDSSDSEEFFGWNDIKTKVDVENYVPRRVDDPEKDIALISSSSGSTGMPKGIGLSHSSILFTLSLTKIDHIPEENRALLLATPLSWISGTMLMLMTCFFGFTRYVPKSTSLDDTLHAIQEGKPYSFVISPSCLHLLIEHPNFQKYDLSSVKLIIAAGSVLGMTLWSKVEDTWKGVKVLNYYGLSETCGGFIASLGVEDMNAIGKLLPGSKVKVVDPVTGQSLGPNKIGECRVKTRSLMTGYYNNEEETKAAFDDKGWFRTGDLVYYNEKEIFYIVGRMKETISYQSYKISPAELESFLICLPGVTDVAIVPVPHEVDINHLGALVVKSPNSNITAKDIIDGVKENFAEYKHLRAGVQFVDSLPRSETGKLKRLEVLKMINNQTNKAYFGGTEH